MSKYRSFLKWPGNKYRVLEYICPRLPVGTKLIEPFVGSGAVFLNTHYPRYLLNDVNVDLIQLYQLLQTQGNAFINYVKDYFKPKNNQPNNYYALREKFNATAEIWERSALFIYLNRHGYNGLCRYNRSGLFNVPFGRYQTPYFPQEEMEYFHKKSQRQVTFMCADFRKSMHRARTGHVVYCDPPYIPLTATASFTSYSAKPFLMAEQHQLAATAESLRQRGVPVIISNHDTPITRQVYCQAQLNFFSVMRTISCKGKQRVSAPELLALYK